MESADLIIFLLTLAMTSNKVGEVAYGKSISGIMVVGEVRARREPGKSLRGLRWGSHRGGLAALQVTASLVLFYFNF